MADVLRAYLPTGDGFLEREGFREEEIKGTGAPGKIHIDVKTSAH